MWNKIAIALAILGITSISIIGCKTLGAGTRKIDIASYAEDDITSEGTDDREIIIFNPNGNKAYPCKMVWVKSKKGDWKISMIEN